MHLIVSLEHPLLMKKQYLYGFTICGKIISKIQIQSGIKYNKITGFGFQKPTHFITSLKITFQYNWKYTDNYPF